MKDLVVKTNRENFISMETCEVEMPLISSRPASPYGLNEYAVFTIFQAEAIYSRLMQLGCTEEEIYASGWTELLGIVKL